MNGQMSDDFRKSATELELLLWALWNPIGFNVPLDEYSRYGPRIWKLLAEHAGTDAVADELELMARDRMEIHRVGDPRRAAIGDVHAVAARLNDWWYWRFDYPQEVAESEETA
jgi:hypothetical protein